MVAASEGARRMPAAVDEIATTEDIPIPTDPLERVIGQEKEIGRAHV